jgi:hexosaminidase
MDGAYVRLFGLFFVFSCWCWGLGSCIWPQPQVISLGTTTITLSPQQFSIQLSSSGNLLHEAARRYHHLFFPFEASSGGDSYTLSIKLQNTSEVLQLGISEHYTLSISQTSAVLNADNVFGAMRGLETFSQLIHWQTSTKTYHIMSVPITIQDWPRFPWRGLLIDTSRHYLTLPAIKKTIEAMSYAKLNTLHWHIVDAQSFPVESNSYPLLTKAAWAPEAVYTHAQIKEVVQHAYEHGIRVIPEFDMPGHSASWGVGYPDIVAKCPKYSANINNLAMDVSNNFTYQLVNGFLSEIAALFPDAYLHLGGDEVVFGCWFDDPAISQWAAKKGFTTGEQIENYFENLLQQMVLPSSKSRINKKMVVWQELFDHNISLDKQNVIVQVWLSPQALADVVKAGYQGLLSAGYYLDQQIPNHAQTWYEWVDTWKNFYNNDPTAGLSLSAEEAARVLGGEAAMWGEQVDETNIESRVWPRAAGTAERLWSDKSVNNADVALPRLVDFRCNSLARRGIGAGPVHPDYCPLPPRK